MADSRDEEGDERRHALADMRSGSAVHVAPEERVNGDIPLARELHPIRRVPPVGVEVAVAEAGDLCEGAKDVLEDDEEDEEEGEHEGEEEPGDGLGEGEKGLRSGGRAVETEACIGQNGQDELLGDNGEEKDATESGDDFGVEGGPVDAFGARVLDFIAEGRAEEVVNVVVPSEVRGVGHVAHG